MRDFLNIREDAKSEKLDAVTPWTQDVTYVQVTSRGCLIYVQLNILCFGATTLIMKLGNYNLKPRN